MGARFTASGTQRALYTGGAPDYNGDHTIFCWVKLATQTASQQVVNIAGSAAGSDWEGLSFLLSAVRFSARMSVGGTAASTEAPSAPSSGTWYCLAVVRRTTTVFDFYVGTTPANLALVGTETGSTAGRAAAARLSLGIVGASTDPLDGSLACVRFWSRELSLAELQAEAASYTPVSSTNLYAAYRLATGTDLSDVSGNGRTLVVTNGPLTDDDDPVVTAELAAAEEFDHWIGGKPLTRLEPYGGEFDHWLGGRPIDALMAPAAQAVTGGTIAAGSTLAAPEVSVAAGAGAVTGGTIASGSAITAPTLAYALTSGTIASGNQRFAPTVIPQAVAVAGGTIVSGSVATAPSAVVVGAATVTGGTIVSGSAATAPSTVTPGAVAITGGTIASGSVVFTAHAVTPGPVAATGGTIASGSVATAPSTVTVGATTVVGGTIAGTTFFPPTVIPQAIAITGGTIAATTLAAPSVGAGAITVTGGTIASGSALTAPALAVGAVTVVGGTVASGAAVSGPAITVGAIGITAGTILSGSTLSPPTVILAGAQVLTNSTVDAGGWEDQLGGTTDLHSPLADVDTLTWDQSPFDPVNATMKLGLTDLPAPGVGEKLVLSIQCEQI